MAEGGKLMKLKSKLADISSQIDEADVRKGDAKGAMIEARSRLEKAESENASIDRRIALLGRDLQAATERFEEHEDKLGAVEEGTMDLEAQRKQLEENETDGDESIQTLEEEIKEAKLKLEENQTKLVETERKEVVVKRDFNRVSTKAESLQKRIQVLEDTIANAKDSFKELEEREGESSLEEERSAEQIILMEGQYKELEVRTEAAERSCNVMERNIVEVQKEIDDWVAKTDTMNEEIQAMDEMDSADED